MTDPAIATTLIRLLDANAGFALGGRGTTNHCPMALCALAAMGASSERLQAFFDQWQRLYSVAAPIERIEVTSASWPGLLGSAAAFPSLRDFFSQRIVRSSADAVLAEVLTKIPFAPATGAFHAVIRLAYGLEAHHPGEIASGLAALVSENLSIGPQAVQREPATSVESGLERISTKFQGKVFPKRSFITAQLREVASDQDFQSALQGAPVAQELFDSLAQVAIALYWQKPDFTTLHMVTGMDAVRRVAERLPSAMRDALRRDTWSAFCATYVAIGTPAIDPARSAVASLTTEQPSLPAWETLLARAIDSDDDHVIKMTYTCWRANSDAQGIVYRAAATRLLGHDAVG